MGSNATRSLADAMPSERVLWLGLLCALELLAVVSYFQLTSAELTSVRYALYPFVWLNVGLVAVVLTSPAVASPRQRAGAALVAGGYFLLLAWATGLVGLAPADHDPTGLAATMASPGWGPTVTYGGSLLTLVLVPFRLLGYLALAYLVYAAVLDSLAASATGLVALFSCVSCTFPLVSSLAASAGGSAAMVATAFAFGIDVSTAVFVVSVALLYWRPGVGRVGA
ncbi:DUF7546 family protein [Haloarchaeobius sp. TZWWS8]|uniref:DUF7546 family protein n=1 Tax=Haloarchaeobius sp. TZWWS8 TaxID=3446121 RepID=UPI003EB85C34